MARYHDMYNIFDEIQTDADAIILAGDICNLRNGEEFVREICKNYKYVLFTTGNHEYAGFTLEEVDELFINLEVKHSNFYYLRPNRKVVELESHRFLGATLWYPITQDVKDQYNHWFDFRTIKNLKMKDIKKAHEAALKYFTLNIKQDDIVVTHMGPSFRSLHSKYIGDKANCFFMSNQEDLIYQTKPRLWIHGHVHDPFDYVLYKTRVITNPRAYKFKGEGKNFNPSLVIDLGVKNA
jgi:Icc-related predicted phosphoesterase